MTEAVVAARRDPAVRDVIREHQLDHERELTALGRTAQSNGEIDERLSVPELVRLTTLVFLGSRAASGVGLPPVDRDEWTRVIRRLIESVKPQGERP